MAVSAAFTQGYDYRTSRDLKEGGRRVCHTVPASQFQRFLLIDMEHGRECQDPVQPVSGKSDSTRAGRKKELRAPFFLEIFHQRLPRRFFHLQPAEIGHGVIFHAVRLHPLFLKGVFDPVQREKRPLPGSLHEAVTAAIFFFGEINRDGKTMSSQRILDEAAVYSAADRGEEGEL